MSMWIQECVAYWLTFILDVAIRPHIYITYYHHPLIGKGWVGKFSLKRARPLPAGAQLNEEAMGFHALVHFSQSPLCLWRSSSIFAPWPWDLRCFHKSPPVRWVYLVVSTVLLRWRWKPERNAAGHISQVPGGWPPAAPARGTVLLPPSSAAIPTLPPSSSVRHSTHIPRQRPARATADCQRLAQRMEAAKGRKLLFQELLLNRPYEMFFL